MESVRHLGTVTTLEHIEKLSKIKPKDAKQACLHLGFGLCAVAADQQRRRWNIKKDYAFSMALVVGTLFYETLTGNKRAYHGKLRGRTIHNLARAAYAEYRDSLPKFNYSIGALHSLGRYKLAETSYFTEDWTWEGSLKLLSELYDDVESLMRCAVWGNIDVSSLAGRDTEEPEAPLKIEKVTRVVANVGGHMVYIKPLNGEDPDLLEKMFEGGFKFLHYRRETSILVNGKEVDIMDLPLQDRLELLGHGNK